MSRQMGCLLKRLLMYIGVYWIKTELYFFLHLQIFLH